MPVTEVSGFGTRLVYTTHWDRYRHWFWSYVLTPGSQTDRERGSDPLPKRKRRSTGLFLPSVSCDRTRPVGDNHSRVKTYCVYPAGGIGKTEEGDTFTGTLMGLTSNSTSLGTQFFEEPGLDPAFPVLDIPLSSREGDAKTEVAVPYPDIHTSPSSALGP